MKTNLRQVGRRRFAPILRPLHALLLAPLFLLAACPPARAQALPQAVLDQVTVSQSGSLNTGNTSFFDAFANTTPGWVYQSYVKYQFATSIKDGNGRNVAFPQNPRVDITSWANQFIYVTPLRIGPGVVGLDLIVPFVNTSASGQFSGPAFPPGKRFTDNGAGIGDIIFGSGMQFDPIMRDGHPILVQRVEFDVIAPTGKYDTRYDVQPGSHEWVLNPFWAVTFLPGPHWETSARFQYVYNFKNNRPSDAPVGVLNTQAGQAGLVNFTASYEIAPKLNLGVNGYYLDQFTQSKVNGVNQTNSKTRYLGIGPGLNWNRSPHDNFSLNFYTETGARNTSLFNVIQIHWIHSFQ